MEEILYPPEDEPPVIVPRRKPEVTYPPEDEPPCSNDHKSRA